MFVLAAADTIQGIGSVATTITYSIEGMELTASGETYKRLAQGQLAIAAGVLYTCPASTTAFIKSMHIVNNSGASATFQLFQGGTAAANQITPTFTIPAGGMAIYDEDGWQFINSDGSIRTNNLLSLVRRVVLTTGTTYTVGVGTKAINVRCIGGGGGGGGGTSVASSASICGGGGGGGYAEKLIVGPKTTAYTIAIGAAGAAGANTGGNGGAGGATTFDSPSVCTANGGAGGTGQTGGTSNIQTAGGVGGTASGVGDFTVTGQPGESGNRVSGTVGNSGDGGNAGGIGGGGGIGLVAQGNGAAGGNYGGGGSGACVLNGGAAATGGAGAQGVIIVDEYA